MMWDMQSYNNSFEWKKCDILGGQKHILTPPTYPGVKTRSQDLRRCCLNMRMKYPSVIVSNYAMLILCDRRHFVLE